MTTASDTTISTRTPTTPTTPTITATFTTHLVAVHSADVDQPLLPDARVGQEFLQEQRQKATSHAYELPESPMYRRVRPRATTLPTTT